MFKLLFTDQASADLDELEKNPHHLKRLRAVRKALAFLETNPCHPSLNTHKYTAFRGPQGQEVFEAYVQNNTPAAYRIFWHYGPAKTEITIMTITSHP